MTRWSCGHFRDKLFFVKAALIWWLGFAATGGKLWEDPMTGLVYKDKFETLHRVG